MYKEERLAGWHTQSLSSRVGTFHFVKNQIIVIAGHAIMANKRKVHYRSKEELCLVMLFLIFH